MVDPPSARLAGDGTPFNSNVPGYEPSKLNVGSGVLTVTSTKGIQYYAPSDSSDTNSQINGLGVGVEATDNPYRIETLLKSPNFASSSGNNSQQAGIWFFLDEDNYVKLAAAKTSGNSYKVQLLGEVAGDPTNEALDLNSAGNLTGDVTLALEVFPVSKQVIGYYTVAGQPEVEIGAIDIPDAFLNGVDHDGSAATANLRYAGIFTTQRRAAANQSIDFQFESFSLGSIVPHITTVDPAEGATDVATDLDAVKTDIRADGGVLLSSLTKANVFLERVGSGSGNPTVDTAQPSSTGGTDAIILSLNESLAPNTTYRFVVTAGVKDEAGTPFKRFESTFTTGDATVVTPTDVEFEQVTVDTGRQFSSLELGPDGKLYGSTILGEIYRFTVLEDDPSTTGINEAGQLVEELKITSLQASEGGLTALVGLTFDPASTANNLVAWVTHTHFDASFSFQNGPDFSGKLSRLSGPNLETVETLVIGLPRSKKDHLTNSIAFGPDGAAYINQGSNNAAGRFDGSWQRSERLLSAAVLRVDTAALVANYSDQNPLNTRTEGTLSLQDRENGAEGPESAPIPTPFYNPYAAGAPVTLFGTGVRNAYDLVWHSNGSLYVPTNGTAAGGNSPSVPSTLPASCSNRPDGGYTGPQVSGINNHEKQRDFMFRVVDGGYYGHPNPTRCEYVLNNGNLTSSTNDPGEGQGGSKYPVGTQPDPNYRGWAYDFGFNQSPNGVLEYQNSAFGGALQGALIVARFSSGNDLIALRPDPTNPDAITEVPMVGAGGFKDPLEVGHNPANGHLYVSEYDRGGNGAKLTLLRPLNN